VFSTPRHDNGVLAEAPETVEILREPLLDANQAAKLLGLPRSSIYAYAKRGDLPHVKIGRHLKFIRGDLERALADRRVGV
jgi:excisionase family DNA binding protein